ncbi:MAG: peptidylprolyl isomerase [Pseudomonadales bacterium]|nr:peptidylprolyl isomerase [Pseudomonadales bacterium]
MSQVVANDLVIAINYTLTNATGEVLDQTGEDQPMEYLHGADNIIPGLENALTGKTTGDKVDVTVEPEDGYGAHEPQMVQQVSAEMFQGVDKIETGMTFQSAGPDGEPMMIMVTAVEDEMVTIDGNHPLAGQTLNFAVEIIGVRAATDDEKQHSHVHGEGCNH